jgi:hypothetical protein
VAVVTVVAADDSRRQRPYRSDYNQNYSAI